MNPELHKITRCDGDVFYVNNNDDKVILNVTPADFGFPRLEWQTRQAYRQYGETPVELTLNDRQIQLQFLSQACDRADLFARRMELLTFLHPRSGGDLTYTFIREDGIQRAINGRATGPGFDATPQDQWLEWDIDDPIPITCFDPIWYDPELTTATAVRATGDELVFPIVFPIHFAIGLTTFTATISYTGSWFVRPSIMITGPCSNFSLYHQELDATISYARAIAAGETLTLDLANQTLISDVDGIDYFGYLSSASDINTFVLDYDPILASGTNTIVARIANATIDSDFVLSYNQRYIGI